MEDEDYEEYLEDRKDIIREIGSAELTRAIGFLNKLLEKEFTVYWNSQEAFILRKALYILLKYKEGK